MHASKNQALLLLALVEFWHFAVSIRTISHLRVLPASQLNLDGMNTLDDSGGDKSDEDDNECEDLSDMCGSRFWILFGVISAVVVLAILIMIATICICQRRQRKNGNTFYWTRRSEERATHKTSTTSGHRETQISNRNMDGRHGSQLQTIPEIHTAQTNHGGTRTPSAPYNPAFSQPGIRIDEPPPPYELAAVIVHENGLQADPAPSSNTDTAVTTRFFGH